MKSITIHALDDDLAEGIEKRAKEDGVSLNKTIKMLLREALGLMPNQVRDRRAEFSDLLGCWSKGEAAEFEAAVQEFDRVDAKDWQ